MDEALTSGLSLLKFDTSVKFSRSDLISVSANNWQSEYNFVSIIGKVSTSTDCANRNSEN